MADTRRDSGFGIRDSGETPRTDLDALIDAVAREMTGAEPSGALRARVLDAIAPGRRQASAVPRWAWAGAAAVLLAAVAVSVWLVRPAPFPGGAPAAVAQQRSAEPGAAAREGAEAAAASGPTAASLPAQPGRPVRQAAVRATAAGMEEADRDSHNLPALAAIEPLRFAAVEPAALQVQKMEIAPLTAMPSIDIPSIDPGSDDIHTADPKKEN
jgi:hypothetical protein